MANAAMRALRAAQAQVNIRVLAGNKELEIILDLEDDDNIDANPPPSHQPEVRDANEALENKVNGLKAFVELVGKEMKSCKTQNENLKTAKDKAEKSNTGLKVELKKLREDLVSQKAGSSPAGMGKQAVATLIKKNLVRHQAKWEEEKAKLVALGANLVKESFENAMAQVSLRNPDLNLDGLSHEFEVLRGRICRVDTEARKLFDADTGEEVEDWDEEGEYHKGN
ncbi:hypothetical protein SESBI_04186 [Sesbania bispinosa]|nr:hypothetical protein SESBI_04186 [Sesbania bispinosa]